jgi:hypothetical protein
MTHRYVKLPYHRRLRLKASRKLRRAANRVEQGLWRENNILTQEEKGFLYDTARVIRERARKAEEEALCRSSES